MAGPEADAGIAAAPPVQTVGGRALVAAAIVWSVSILLLNIIPVVFQGLQLAWAVAPGQLGVLGALSMLGAGLVTASGPYWAVRVNARRVTALALLVGAAALGLMVVLGRGFLLPGFLILGLSGGVVSTPAYAALGNAADPTRAYSRALFLAVILAAVASVALSMLVIPRFGGAAVLLALGAVYLLTVPCALFLTDIRAAPLAAPAATPRGRWRASAITLAAPIVVAFGGALYQAARSGTYQMISAVGAAIGVRADAIGPLVSLAIIASLAGTILPAILGDRIRARHMVAISAAGAWLAYYGMAHADTLIFGAGFILHTIVMTQAYIYILGAIRTTDASNRMYIAYPAILSVAIAAGVAGAGFLIANFGPAMLFKVNAALVVIGWLALAFGEQLAARRR